MVGWRWTLRLLGVLKAKGGILLEVYPDETVMERIKTGLGGFFRPTWDTDTPPPLSEADTIVS
jgi:hypothetical protein